MSSELHDFEVRQSEDRIDPRKTMAVTIASIVITGMALAVAWALLEAWGDKPRQTAPPVAPRTIGTLEQTLVLDTKRGIDLRAEQAASLHRWEWVDRDAGVARIPIEAALDLLAAEPLPPDRPLAPPAPGSPAAAEPR